MKKLSKPMIAAIIIGKIAQHAFVFLTLAGLSAAVLAKEVHEYMEGVPEITPCYVTVSPEITLSCEELAHFEQTEHAGIVTAYWEDGSTDDLYIPQDGQTLEIGAQTGTLTVHVQAVGATEYTDEMITVTVRDMK